MFGITHTRFGPTSSSVSAVPWMASVQISPTRGWDRCGLTSGSKYAYLPLGVAFPASELIVFSEDVVFILSEVLVAPRFHVAIHERHVSFLIMPTGRLLLG